MARVISGCLLIAVALLAVVSTHAEAFGAGYPGSNPSEALLGGGIVAFILLFPGCLLVHFGSGRRALWIFLLPGLFFVWIHWAAVRSIFTGSDTWSTPHLILMNLVVDMAGGAFLAIGLYPVVRRLTTVSEDAYARGCTLAVVMLVIGLTIGEAVVNDRHRGGYVAQLKSADVKTRIAAAEELAKTGYNGAIPAMAAALSDPEPQVRVLIARALGASESRDAAEPLRRALADSDPYVRATALESLQRLWEKRREPPPVAEIARLFDDDRSSHAAAARLLQSAGGAEAEAVLLQELRRGNTVAVAAAYDFYLRRGEPGSEPLLVRALQDHGTKEMAVALLNSGNGALASAAQEWAASRGYEIRTETASETTTRWGQGRR